MRNPIRTRGGGAARPIHYSLKPGCAWLLLLLAVLHAGCSEQAPLESGAPAAAAPAPTFPTTGDPRPLQQPERRERPVIVFLGTSLTAGYGLEESKAFPALIGERIEEAGLGFQVVNAGVSGDTSAGGLRRLAWLLRLPISVLVLELGANDMLRGQQVDQLRSNLEAILDHTREAHPNVKFVIAGMRAAPNLGRDYGDAFDAIYPELAKRYQAAFVPFLLEDVAARRNLNQADGIHPTAEGHALIADRLWKSLEPILR